MQNANLFRCCVAAAVLVTAACSEDVPVGDPGGMGAGQLEAPGEEVPAIERLQRSGPGPLNDSGVTVDADEGVEPGAADRRTRPNTTPPDPSGS